MNRHLSFSFCAYTYFLKIISIFYKMPLNFKKMKLVNKIFIFLFKSKINIKHIHQQIFIKKMDNTNETNDAIYINLSKRNIDNAIYKNDFLKAFSLLIMVLDRLDNNQKIEFIHYYNSKLSDIIRGPSHLNPMNISWR